MSIYAEDNEGQTFLEKLRNKLSPAWVAAGILGLVLGYNACKGIKNPFEKVNKVLKDSISHTTPAPK